MPDPEVVAQTLEVASSAAAVVVDLGRWRSPARAAALRRCDLIVLLCGADVRSVTGARAVRLGLDGCALGVVVMRAGRDLAPASRVAELVGAPLVGVVPADPGATTRRSIHDHCRGRWLGLPRGVLDAVREREVAA